MRVNILPITVIISSLILISSVNLRVNAQENVSTSLITADIKISVCGNNIIEGGEDCEGHNLNNKSCLDVGYRNGTLSCDVSCTFDTYQCSDIITPQPTVRPTPQATSQSTATSIPVATEENIVESVINAVNNLSLLEVTPVPTPTLPYKLIIFDFSGDGKIYESDLPQVLQLWVNEWKESIITLGQYNVDRDVDISKCDLNEDNRCDVRDLSILMYYVER